MCKASYYLHNQTCNACPLGVDCSSQGVQLGQLPLEPGYWRSYNESDEVHQCFTPEACVGFSTGNASVCREGHEGAFCEVCQEQFYKAPDGLCAQCAGNLAAGIAFPVCALVVAVGLALWFCLRGGKSLNAAGTAMVKEVADPDADHGDVVAAAFESAAAAVTSRAEATTEVARGAAAGAPARRLFNWERLGNKLRILISTFQVLTPLGIVYKIAFPPMYETLLRWLNVLQLNFIDVMPLACLLDTTYHTTLLLRTLLPILVLLIIFAVRSWAKRISESQSDAQKKAYYQWVAEGCVTVAFLLLFLIYPSTSQCIFYAFQCLRLDDGSSLLRIDLSISCSSSGHKAAVAYAVVMTLVYPIGIPALFFCILRRYDAELQGVKKVEASLAIVTQQLAELPSPSAQSDRSLLEKSVGSSGPTAAPTIDELKTLEELYDQKRAELPDYLLKLVGAFEFRVFWFELFECLRKLLLVGAPVFFDPPGSVQQLIYGLMVCFLIFGANSWFKPYAEPGDNSLASLCQAQIFFSLLTAVVNAFDVATLRLNRNLDVLLVLLTLLPAAVVVCQELRACLPSCGPSSALMKPSIPTPGASTGMLRKGSGIPKEVSRKGSGYPHEPRSSHNFPARHSQLMSNPL